MHVLLSRAAKARTSCRCFSCGQAAKVVTRRAINAPTKRRVGLNDVFTACYSSLIASAVIADVEVKQQRRKKWDQAIEEARAENSEAELVGNGQEFGETTYSKISAQCSSIVESHDNFSPLWRADQVTPGDISGIANTPLQQKLKALDLRITHSLESEELFPGEQEARLSQDECSDDSVPVEDPEQNIVEWADENPIPLVGFRHYVKRVYLEQTEEAMDSLISDILDYINNSMRRSTSQGLTGSQETRKLMATIRDLRGGFSKFPIYSWKNEREYKHTRNDLHASIYSICQTAKSEPSTIELTLAKLCYNLLVSATPPNIITFNILIGELQNLNQHAVVRLVITTFFNQTRLAPNFQTMQLMLDHHIATNDKTGFQFMLARMKGVAQTPETPNREYHDMRIGHRAVKDLTLPHVQRWAKQMDVIRRNGYLIRKAPRNAEILNSTISGSLHFGNLRQAIRYYGQGLSLAEVREKWTHVLAAECAAKREHVGGFRMLQYLLKFWKDENGNTVLHLSAQVRAAIHNLLGLLGVYASPATNMLPKLHLYRRFEPAVHELLIAMQLESAKDALADITKHISVFTSALGVSSKGVVLNKKPNVLDWRRLDELSSKAVAKQARFEKNRAVILRNQRSFLEKRLEKSEEMLQVLKTKVYELPSHNPQIELSSGIKIAKISPNKLQPAETDLEPAVHQIISTNSFDALAPSERLQHHTRKPKYVHQESWDRAESAIVYGGNRSDIGHRSAAAAM